MELDIASTPIAMRSASAAPTFRFRVAGVCPQAGNLPVDVHAQGKFWTVDDAGMAPGYRPWKPLIT
jgi:hypothetical protein